MSLLGEPANQRPDRSWRPVRSAPIDWQAIRERLKTDDGAEQMWRSLEELAADETVRRHLPREFDPGAEFMRDPITRRRFLQLRRGGLSLEQCAPRLGFADVRSLRRALERWER